MRAVLSRSLTALPLLAFASGAPALDAPRKLVDYDIQVELNPEAKTIAGTETLRWTNPSGDRIPDLQFHLYWNAFRNNRSTFFKESGGQLRGDKADQDTGWGSIDVTSMVWNGEELSKRFRFISPDDGNPDDRTVLSIPLPRPVEPNETIELKIAWKGKVPRVYARAGYVRDFFFIGQWYPKIGVYEPAGRRRREAGGWNCHQYHANSEFYADWGDYRVAITVPERFVVASAGARVDEKKASGKKTLTFVQKDIHDFAWTTDPRYVVKEDVFDPAVDLPAGELERASKILGRSPADLRKGFRKVELRFYMQPDHERQWVRYQGAQKWALAWFGLYAFPYPYGQVSVIDTPEDGEGASGMEYQTIYTAGTSKWLGRWPLDKIRTPEMVAIHEFGHGYWYGLVASNEFEESWMDEGINSFTEAVMCDRKYGYFLELPFGAGITDEDTQRLILTSHDYDPIITSSWGFWSGNSYGRNSYPRTATVIQQIRRMVGEERFWRGFRAYSERWRYDHPTSEDFFEAIQQGAFGPAGGPRAPGGPDQATMTGVAGLGQSDVTLPLKAENPSFTAREYRALIRRTFYGTGFVDFRVLQARSDELTDAFTGYDDRGKPVNFTDAKDEKKRKKKDDDEKGPWETRVVIGRDGDIVLPVDVVLTFENGKTHRATWDGHGKWFRLRTTYGSKLAKVEVDPEQKVVLDGDPWNNARHLKPWKGASAARKVRTYTAHLAQIVMSSLWAIGL